jgi:hypothetical protein
MNATHPTAAIASKAVSVLMNQAPVECDSRREALKALLGLVKLHWNQRFLCSRSVVNSLVLVVRHYLQSECCAALHAM